MLNINDKVKSYLSKKYIHVSNEWIMACVGWLQEEHSNQIQNVNNCNWLGEKAYEQWLFSDLTELGCGRLPQGIKDDLNKVLDQDIILQINSIHEVGLPAYTQLQQLRKDDIQNTLVDTEKTKQQSWEPKPTRMLLLNLTDGVTELKGMEYRPIAAISLQTKPGTKVLVRAGVNCRRGVLLLTTQYVSVLGGAVDQLLTTNAPENLINRALGLPETATPRDYLEVPDAHPPAVVSQQASQYYPGSQTRTGSSQLIPTQQPSGLPSRLGCNPPNGGSNRPQPSLCPESLDMEDNGIVSVSRVLVGEQAGADQRQRTGADRSGLGAGGDPLGIDIEEALREGNAEHAVINQMATGNNNQPRISFNKRPTNYNIPLDSDFQDDGFDDVDFEALENEARSASSQCIAMKVSTIQDQCTVPHVAKGKSPSNNNKKFPVLNVNDSEGYFDDYNCNIQNSILINKKASSKSGSVTKTNPIRGSVKRPSVTADLNEDDALNRTQQLRKQTKLSDECANSEGKKGKQKDSIIPVSRINNTAVIRPVIAVAGTSNSSTERDSVIECVSVLSSTAYTAAPDGTGSSSTASGSPHTVPPFSYLCFLPQRCKEEQLVTVKGFVMTLISRLDPSSGEWRLPVKINDGTASCDVDIHDQVLRELIGLSVLEMSTLKAQASTDSSVRARLTKSVGACQRELISLSCLLQLQLTPGHQRPLLLQLQPLQQHHMRQMRARSLSC